MSKWLLSWICWTSSYSRENTKATPHDKSLNLGTGWVDVQICTYWSHIARSDSVDFIDEIVPGDHTLHVYVRLVPKGQDILILLLNSETHGRKLRFSPSTPHQHVWRFLSVFETYPRFTSSRSFWSSAVIAQSLSLNHSLQPHGLQHARLSCPSLSLGVCSNSYSISLAKALIVSLTFRDPQSQPYICS